MVIHALKNKRVVVAGQSGRCTSGKNVSIAHNALVHGAVLHRDDTFVGFKAVVHDSVVGAHCSSASARSSSASRFRTASSCPTAIVDSADAVARLPEASAAHHEVQRRRGRCKPRPRRRLPPGSQSTGSRMGRSRQSGSTRSAPSVWSPGAGTAANPYRF